VAGGGMFSYATARSIVTSSKVAKGFNATLPVICANGAFILDPNTRGVLVSHNFTKDEVDFVAEIMASHSVLPLVYALIDSKERFSFVEHKNICIGLQNFFNDRKDDPRKRQAATAQDLYHGNVYYFNYIGDKEKLKVLYDIFVKDKRFYSIFSKDVYSDDWFFEILPKNATKAAAALELKKMLGCDRLVVFGDGVNDKPMFAVADESYAMANAVSELKEIATDVIESNDNDGVAKWIEKNTM